MPSKTCSKCSKEKDNSEFYVRDKKTGRLWAHCKLCFNQYQRSWSHRPKNKPRLRDKSKALNKARRELLQSIKTAPCADCGQSYPPYVMDFDHREGEKKLFQIGSNIRKPLHQLEEEIKKCDVVCSNCHRVRTHKRRLLLIRVN